MTAALDSFEVIADLDLDPADEFFANLVVSFDHFIAGFLRGGQSLRDVGLFAVAEALEAAP